MLPCKTKSTKKPACSSLFLPALLHKQDFHDQTSIHWTAGHSLPILQQSVITEPIKFSSQTRSTKIIIMSLQGWKKFFHLFIFLHPLYCSFTLFGYFWEVGRRIIFIALYYPSSLGDMEEWHFIWSVSLLCWFGKQQERQIRHWQILLYIMLRYM